MRFVIAATSNHPIENDPKYNDFSKTFLTPEDITKDSGLVNAEIDRIKKIIPQSQKSIIDEQGISIDKSLFLSRLKDAASRLKQQDMYSEYNKSEMSKKVGDSEVILDESPEQADADKKRRLAAIQRLIRERQENIADLDGYVLQLLMGGRFSPFTASGKSKFVKIADDLDKQADKVIEEYYDDLYEESEGSPNYGKVLNNPEKYHHTLTTDASTTPKPSKFKKI